MSEREDSSALGHQGPETRLERIDRRIAQCEAVLVVAVLAVMVLLSATQLFLHKLFDTGFVWADIVVRQMVLWLGFIGGALATYEGRHIAIDAAGKFFPPKFGAAMRVLTSVAAMIVSAIMTHAAFTFVRDEMEAESTVFGDTPAWPFEIVMPIALAAIVFHFFVSAYKSLLVALDRRAPALSGEIAEALERPGPDENDETRGQEGP